MEITRRLVVLFIFLLLGATANAQFTVGLIAGVNQGSLSGDAPNNTKYTTRSGTTLGLDFEVGFAKDVSLVIQPRLLQKGTNIAFDVPGEKEKVDSAQVKLGYFSVPVLVKVVSGNGKTYVVGGLDLGFLSNAKASYLENSDEEVDIKDIIRSVDVAVNFGFGAMFPIGKPRLMVEARYTQGLLNISESEATSTNGSLPPQFKTTGFQFLTGILIPLGTTN